MKDYSPLLWRKLNGVSQTGFALISFPRVKASSDTFGGFVDKYAYIHPFVSPEFNINGGKSLGSGDYRLYITRILKRPLIRKRDGSFGDVTEAVTDTVSSSILIPITSYDASATDLSSITTTLPVATVNRGTTIGVADFKKMSVIEKGGGGHTFTADGDAVTVYNRVISSERNTAAGNADDTTMYSQTGMTIFISELPIPVKDFNETGDGPSEAFMYILDLYQNNATSRYGGDTYRNRLLNRYEPASAFVSAGISTPTLQSWGDTYNTIFDTLLAAVDKASINDPKQVVGLLPMESTVNCALTSVKPSSYYDKYPKSEGDLSVFLNEIQVKGIELWADKYPLLGDLNRYNPVYSVTNKYPVFLPKPALFTELKTEPFTVVNSQVKTTGELIDSWAKFNYADFIEVDSRYGTIHGLSNYNNRLIFFQETAIGSLAVNERYIIGQDAAQLALGTGGVLERYDYVKYNAGIIKPEHFINTSVALFYMDGTRRVFDIMNDSPIALSVKQGINSLIRAYYKDKDSFAILGFDPVYNEILLTIGYGTSYKTIVYNGNRYICTIPIYYS